jgi:predicted transcriptional regulator
MIRIAKILDKYAKDQGIKGTTIAKLLSMKDNNYNGMVAGILQFTKYRFNQLIEFLELEQFRPALEQWNEREKVYRHIKTIKAMEDVDDATVQAFASFIFFKDKITIEQRQRINDLIFAFTLPHIKALPERMARIANDEYRSSTRNRT